MRERELSGDITPGSYGSRRLGKTVLEGDLPGDIAEGGYRSRGHVGGYRSRGLKWMVLEGELSGGSRAVYSEEGEEWETGLSGTYFRNLTAPLSRGGE